MTTTTLAPLQFHKTTLHPVAIDGKQWFTANEIGEALGYANGRKAILNLYNENAAEFDGTMTKIVATGLSSNQGQTSEDLAGFDPETGSNLGGNPNKRFFSLRGMHLIGMKARTERAAEFRSWVLDVLEGVSKPVIEPLAAAPVSNERIDRLLRMVEKLLGLIPQLLAQSTHKPKVKRHSIYESDIAAIQEMYAQGNSITDISRAAGFSPTQVWGVTMGFYIVHVGGRLRIFKNAEEKAQWLANPTRAAYGNTPSNTPRLFVCPLARQASAA